MFEYYTYKLANKPINQAKNSEKEAHPIDKKRWLIIILLATSFASFITFAPLGGYISLIPALLAITALCTWLIIHLKAKPLKNKSSLKKLIQFVILIILAIILAGVLYGVVSVLAHMLMHDTHHLGQIATTIDLMTRGIILLITPIIIILFLRFIIDKKLRQKISPKTYLELLITIALGLLLSGIPNTLIFRSQAMTYTIQFLSLTLINTILITAIITTCKNRGQIP